MFTAVMDVLNWRYHNSVSSVIRIIPHEVSFLSVGLKFVEVAVVDVRVLPVWFLGCQRLLSMCHGVPKFWTH